jgi:hypothetical protein
MMFPVEVHMEQTISQSDPELQAARRRRSSLRRSMNSVEIALASPAPGRVTLWGAGVSSAVEDLQRCMRDHVDETEGPQGFHREIVAAAPRLAHRVDVSAKQHVAILGLSSDLLSATAQLPTDNDVEGVRDQGTQLLTLISRHLQGGADMIYEAFESDIGGEN